jgi:pimeloyl-ACP methyl ester carboxylesterase
MGSEYSAEDIEQWRRADTIPFHHHGFDRELPLHYGFHEDGLRYGEPIPPVMPAMIIHGRKDETVPIEYSRQYAADFPDRIELIEVDSVHTLYDQLPFIWDKARSFLIDAE